MNGWQQVNLKGGASIEKIAASFRIADLPRMPYGSYKIQVLETMDGLFKAMPNIAYKNPEGIAAWTHGEGKTIQEALQNAVLNLTKSIPECAYRKYECFEWADPIHY